MELQQQAKVYRMGKKDTDKIKTNDFQRREFIKRSIPSKYKRM